MRIFQWLAEEGALRLASQYCRPRRPAIANHLSRHESSLSFNIFTPTDFSGDRDFVSIASRKATILTSRGTIQTGRRKDFLTLSPFSSNPCQLIEGNCDLVVHRQHCSSTVEQSHERASQTSTLVPITVLQLVTDRANHLSRHEVHREPLTIRLLMLSTFIGSKPSGPARSISLLGLKVLCTQRSHCSWHLRVDQSDEIEVPR